MLHNVLGASTTLGCLFLLSLLDGLSLVPARATTTSSTTSRGRTEQGSLGDVISANDHANVSSSPRSAASPKGVSLSERTESRKGPYVKYTLGNAGVLIAFVGGTSYGVKRACTAASTVHPAQVCVGSLVAALVADLVAAAYLEDVG